MRVVVFLISLLAFPMAAWAQSAPLGSNDPAVTVVPSAPVAGSVPKPRLHVEVDAYRVAAIAAGAVAGVVVANVVTGGLITPILVYGTNGGAGAVVSAGYTHAAAQALVTLGGALGGGYIGNWLYSEQ